MMVDLVDLKGLVVVENESERHILHINSIFINVNSSMECHPIVGDKQKWTRLSMHSSMHSSDDRDVISKISNHLAIIPLNPFACAVARKLRVRRYGNPHGAAVSMEDGGGGGTKLR